MHAFNSRVSLQNATEELERLGYAFDAVKKQLLGRLHDLARKQIGFDPAPVKAASESSGALHSLNGAEANGSHRGISKTGMTEVAEAVSSTFTDK